MAGAAGTETRRASSRPPTPADCLLIPPALEDRVLFYHGFSRGPGRPEINRLGGEWSAGDARAGDGLAGPGAALAGAEAKRGMTLTGLDRPLARPLTVLVWWRLDAPVGKQSAYDLVGLHGEGWISNFVRSGPWCGLTEPTFVLQVYRWPGVTNVNHVHAGSGIVETGVWHHAAMVVARGSVVRVYWDGRERADVHLKGRFLGTGDRAGTLALGNRHGGHPMTVDEVLVLDVALPAGAVRDAMDAVRHLADRALPAALSADRF